ncbi:MAG: hypothetical protein MUP98_17495 [Candidatus Aminicenantes bacterium]|nr:hypothetical protein [Candidatus Aminicenantes bacterium]
MVEFFLELFLDFLVFMGIRKRKKSTKLESDAPVESICAGCHRRLQKQIIYEWGKMWCKDCYKSDVLKINI